MTEPDRKFEEAIRRELCAATDLIVPAGDGLNLIRERTARRPLVPRWLLACATHLPRQLVRAGTVAASEVAATIHGHSSLSLVLASARRWPGKAHRGLRTPSLWLRPVLATATALLLVIAVTLSIPRLRATVGAQLDSAFGSNSSGQNPGSGPAGPGAGGAQSTGATPMITGTATNMLGKPFLATMPPPGARCRAHGTGGTAVSDVPPSLGPVVSQTGGTGANAGVTTSATCYPSTAPAKANRATSLPPPPTTTVPTTTPPTTTVPTTTPPTTTPPTTTPPTTTPPTTTPPTSPDSNTSSADSTASTGTPTETPSPGG